MRYYVVILLLYSTCSFSDTKFNCSDLIGTWQGMDYQYSLASQRKSITKYSEKGIFNITFSYDDGITKKTSSEEGLWECDGHFVTIFTTSVDGKPAKYKDTYRLIELNSSYKKYTPVNVDCTTIEGDCKGVVFEETKL